MNNASFDYGFAIVVMIAGTHVQKRFSGQELVFPIMEKLLKNRELISLLRVTYSDVIHASKANQ